MPLIVAASLGLLWGSFVGVLVDRVPSDEPGILTGRSRCGSCGRTLTALDLIPVASWIVLRGRCRGCAAPIGLRPLLVELGTAALFAVSLLSLGDGWTAAVVAPFLGVLFGLTLIDLEHHRLPNAIVYPALLVGAVSIGLGAWLGHPLDAVHALVGAASFGGGLLLVAIVSGGGMGLGDVKLGALIGMVVGAVDLPSVAVAAGAAVLLGGLVAVWALVRGAGRRTAIPFGPMMSAGALIAVVAGPRIVDAYVTAFL